MRNSPPTQTNLFNRFLPFTKGRRLKPINLDAKFSPKMITMPENIIKLLGKTVSQIISQPKIPEKNVNPPQTKLEPIGCQAKITKNINMKRITMVFPTMKNEHEQTYYKTKQMLVALLNESLSRTRQNLKLKWASQPCIGKVLNGINTSRSHNVTKYANLTKSKIGRSSSLKNSHENVYNSPIKYQWQTEHAVIECKKLHKKNERIGKIIRKIEEIKIDDNENDNVNEKITRKKEIIFVPSIVFKHNNSCGDFE